ncbi:MAG: four helix bundle protein [Pirellulaceae bacterium]
MFKFEKLEVWQLSIVFADRVYAVTSAFPGEERFGLTSQLRRAAVSISSNIAEGSSRSSDSDFARFIEIAYGSLMEVVSQIHLANRREFVRDEDLQDIRVQAERLAKMLSGLRAKLRPDTRKNP